jgi:hypothetical protein
MSNTSEEIDINQDLKDEGGIPVIENSKPVEFYEFADLVMKCKCGEVNTFQKGVPSNQAIQLLLVGTPDSQIRLTCEKCSADIMLCMVKSSEEDMIEFRAKAELELNKDKENESVQKTDKTVEMDMGVSSDNQSSTEINS